MLKAMKIPGKRTRAALSMTFTTFDWVIPFRTNVKLNSTSSTNTNTIQETIHMSRQVTYDTLGTDLDTNYLIKSIRWFSLILPSFT